MSQYSIAQAKDQLTQIIRAAEVGDSVEITRRGEPVAVILSIAEYQKLQPPRPNFGEAVKEFREYTAAERIEIDPDEIFGDIRDRSPGREIDLS
ncbi:type II toxin-antitoxin system Phd/YefM family antitoxin [Halomicronema sp. CCY15110]|uniref:type II toxin-antitoxin system Phd/YefM family antitoxin n=1 Tax=Halomicronema sp. CCY15110 TaxID=2767773 RepID=UPI00194F1C37|nr:type II toxin-antitoxin system Phd/YefM family antitoxin [Halomicronema sp. CCY15110]